MLATKEHQNQLQLYINYKLTIRINILLPKKISLK